MAQPTSDAFSNSYSKTLQHHLANHHALLRRRIRLAQIGAVDRTQYLTERGTQRALTDHARDFVEKTALCFDAERTGLRRFGSGNGALALACDQTSFHVFPHKITYLQHVRICNESLFQRTIAVR